MGILNTSWTRRGAALLGASAIALFGLAGCGPGPKNLQVTTVLSGLSNPWDLAFTPDGSMLFTERPGPIKIRTTGGAVRTLATPADVRPMSEGGMMGIAVDPAFASNRRIYTCFLSNAGGALDVRLVRWHVNAAASGLDSRADIVTGIPVNTAGQAGRHSGCRARFGPDGNLWIGTGDAAINYTAQSPTSLGGKVLRVNTDGAGVNGNLTAPFDHRIQSYGHRNVQGIAFRQNGQAFSIEHGTDRDDEVNFLVDGANYGWDPRPLGGGSLYDESRPMTDTTRYPDAKRAVWTSGYPTIAPSGGTFLQGSQWAGWDSALAMAVLKGQQLRVLDISGGNDKVTQEYTALTSLGRLRVAVQGPDGDLYLAQDANPGSILRVHPTS